MSQLDIAFERFGRLVAVRRVPNIQGSCAIQVLCKCDCGNETIVKATNLRREKPTKSCGCLAKEKRRGYIHGMSSSPEFNTWAGIQQRCTDVNDPTYQRYGARGITVCDEWKHFEDFYADMGPRPSPDHSIDRIDNEAGYCKSNCKWSTRKEQCRNRRSTHVVEYQGREMSLMEATEIAGAEYHLVKKRIYRGWDIDRALSEPSRGNGYSGS